MTTSQRSSFPLTRQQQQQLRRFAAPRSLTGADDLNFGFLPHVLGVVEMGVATAAAAATEPDAPPAEEGVALAVVSRVRITQQNDLRVRLRDV